MISTYPSVPWTRSRCPSPIRRVACSTFARLATVAREHLKDGRDVALLEPEFGGPSEDLLGGARRGQLQVELGRRLQSQADVLVHQPDVEPSLIWEVEYEGC